MQGYDVHITFAQDSRLRRVFGKVMREQIIALFKGDRTVS